jgi:hypothetical protein
MSMLLLTKTWINRMDTGEAIAAQSDPDSGQTSWANEGEVRLYASGRRRSVTVEGEGGTVPFTLLEVTLAQVELLRTWKGVNVLVRDHRGRRWFGVFFNVVETPQRNYTNIYTAAFTLQTTTTVEGV